LRIDASSAKALADRLEKSAAAQRVADSFRRLPVDGFVSRVSPRLAWIAAAMLAGALAGLINGTMLSVDQHALSRAFSGLIEGALLGSLLHIVLRNHAIPVSARRWILTLTGAAILRAIVPLSGWPDAGFLGVATKGLLDGVIMGGAMAWALRFAGFIRTLWILTNVVGWVLVALWFNSAYSLAFPRIALEQDYPSFLIGAASGLFFGASTSLVLPWLRTPKADIPGPVP
jgi:hypothetical protein